MTAKFLDDKKVQTITTPPPGYFAVHRNPLAWQRCREQFEARFTETTRGFYFSHQVNHGSRVAEFISKTEDVLGLSNDNRTLYATTNRSFALWIEPSEFWKSCRMKRSLFTILLRCGKGYDKEKDNYEEMLYEEKYVFDTEKAIQRFLFGFTDFVEDEIALGNEYKKQKGWVNTFRSKTEIQITKQLILPNGVESEECLAGLGSIWI